MAEEELKRRCEALEEQARRDEAERCALRQQLAAHDKLAQRRAEDEEVARLEQRGAAVLVQQRDEHIRALKEDLRLERDLVSALREQVNAMEAVRETDARELRELQGRRSAAPSTAGTPVKAGAASPPAAAGDATWESILSERV